MIFKIRTSRKTMESFNEIMGAEGFQPFILSKLAISMSLKNEEKLTEKDFHTDNNGLELNRQTITGEYDVLFKGLIEMYEGRHIEDDEYFSKYLKAHLDRGAKQLYSEYKYQGDFITSLITGREGL